MKYIIIAPHPDDEIIGCHGLLRQAIRLGEKIGIFYADIDFQSSEIARWIGLAFSVSILQGSLASHIIDTHGQVCLVAPDPYYEAHPEHRRWGQMSERYFREGQIDRLMFYSTIMRAPYIFEVSDPRVKKSALDLYYPDKSDLWKFDHRYFIFEGRIEWHRADL